MDVNVVLLIFLPVLGVLIGFSACYYWTTKHTVSKIVFDDLISLVAYFVRAVADGSLNDYEKQYLIDNVYRLIKDIRGEINSGGGTVAAPATADEREE